MKPYETITEKDIERWNTAAEMRHGHKNRNVLEGITVNLVAANSVQIGSNNNDLIVWDNPNQIYKPITTQEARRLMQLKGTNTEMEALALNLAVDDIGLWYYNTTHKAYYHWDGTQFI